MNPEQQIAQSIMDEKRIEKDAKTAQGLLKELAALMAKMEALAKSCGASPHDPINFCRTLVLSYGMNKLESPIIKAQ